MKRTARNVMQLMKCQSNGGWVHIRKGEENFYLDRILNREKWLAPRMKRNPMDTREDVMKRLRMGETFNWDDEWYAKIKMDLPAPTCPDVEDGHKTAETQESSTPFVEMVECDCGHTIAMESVMSTSTGTSCPDCYDRMSM